MHPESHNYAIGNFLFVLFPILWIESPDLPVSKHSLPVIFHYIFPLHCIKVSLLFVNKVHVAPNLLRNWEVLVGKRDKTESWRPLCGISQNRDSIVRNSVVSDMLLSLVKIGFKLNPLLYHWEICLGQVRNKSVNVRLCILSPWLLRVAQLSKTVTTQ